MNNWLNPKPKTISIKGHEVGRYGQVNGIILKIILRCAAPCLSDVMPLLQILSRLCRFYSVVMHLLLQMFCGAAAVALMGATAINFVAVLPLLF
jgi:hypothetical protein